MHKTKETKWGEMFNVKNSMVWCFGGRARCPFFCDPYFKIVDVANRFGEKIPIFYRAVYLLHFSYQCWGFKCKNLLRVPKAMLVRSTVKFSRSKIIYLFYCDSNPKYYFQNPAKIIEWSRLREMGYVCEIGDCCSKGVLWLDLFVKPLACG